MNTNGRVGVVILILNVLMFGFLLGQALPVKWAQAQEDDTEEGPVAGDAQGMDRLPPQMIYQSMSIPGNMESKDPMEMRPRQGFFIYDTVNNTMRIYAFNNLHTKGSRGDIELVAVRDVQWDAMLIDSGLSFRDGDSKKIGKGIVEAQGLRPRDIFKMLMDKEVIDKNGNRLTRVGGLTK